MTVFDRVPFTALGLLWPFGAPPQPAGSREDADSGGGRAFRLVTANALKSNRRPHAWADAVLALDGDVLCVEELTPAIHAALRSAAGDRLPAHSCVDVQAGSGGTGLWSRFSLADARVVDAGYAMVVAAIPELGTTLAAVHTVAPSGRSKVGPWWASFDAVHTLADATDGPLVVAGDWNATMGHGPLRRIVRAGRLRDAHVDAGRPYARTWPAHVPVALLDRVLVSREVAVRSIAEHHLPGSDHRAVAADLVVA